MRMRNGLAAAAAAAFLAVVSGPAAVAAPAVPVPKQSWSFQGLFGTYDRGALQRGFQVYDQSCAGCHATRLVYYRHLEQIGFSEDQVKEIAARRQVIDGPDDEGQMFERPAEPIDRFVSPFPNEQAARLANNGAYPPDLSLIVKARFGGADYLYALMTGYQDAPADVEVPQGMYYNAYFPGHLIAMPPPLAEGAVEYPENIPGTVDQMARDLTTFLAWTAEPEMEDRKRMGVKVLLFLLIFTGLLYAVKRKVWAGIKH
jgi:ubiquinol-cytochrome c reductase cytochrome c1 subunit